ncbi:hypothetical protein B0H13DRAFT_2324963 [Mycena leptocephala]|nr:hypothetical protein B0H13DRAFT_2324963 [Mycena leptocephala]
MRALFAEDGPSEGEPIVCTVDHTYGYPTWYNGLLEEESAKDEHGDVCWDEHVARAAWSGGAWN